MTLEQWLKEQLATDPKTSTRAVLTKLAKRAGVSMTALTPLAKGGRMGNYDKALAVSKATDWRVTIPELCQPFPDPQALVQFQALIQVLGAP